MPMTSFIASPGLLAVSALETGVTNVHVNEQNASAVGFYRSLRFAG